MSKFGKISTNSSGGTTTSGNSSISSSSSESEDIGDLFRARVAALNVDDAVPLRHPVASHTKPYRVQKFNHVGMDTEFPGVVILPDVNCRNTGEYQFDVIRTNVDALKLIQLGISFFDANGNPPPGISTWQFNFRFNLKTDLNARDSINLLKNSGVQFDRLQSEGIDPLDFCELFISSGLVLNPDVVWLTYHGGYDFGYLMRILLGRNLPPQGEEFLKIMEVFFPCCYDVKVMLADYGNIRGGLQDISLQLGLKRIGIQHQAGSDALLTGMTFFRIKQRYFGNLLRHKKFNGRIHGLFLPAIDGNADSSRLHQSRSNIK
ncbi:unnamed protein product [Allacma fusca]|uniref:Uncharacterized protein n=1 Tax=Allacma fusca TaxID=39272 RepID=A0A8J2JZY5_9HEXA|nr:unnamed protein product [Allacma fusca]